LLSPPALNRNGSEARLSDRKNIEFGENYRHNDGNIVDIVGGDGGVKSKIFLCLSIVAGFYLT